MQLDLLRWTPPTADVIPFPTSKRVGKIRRVARHIVEGTQKSATDQWNRAVRGLEGQMERAGIPDDRITAELVAFREAVEAEVTRLNRGGASGHGGAA